MTEISLIVGLSLLAQSPFTPVSMPARPTSIRMTAMQMLDFAEHVARRGQQEKAVKILRVLMDDRDPGIRNEARFRLAAIASASGNYLRAATLLRRIVDERPNAGTARLELAAVLAKLGDEGGALRQLRALRTADLPPNVARFIDRMSATLHATKPLAFHLELALAPDSNVNRATRSESLGTVFGDFVINENVRSGVGASARGMAQARIPVSASTDFVTRLTGDANVYRDGDFNDVRLDLSAGPEFRFRQRRASAELGITRHWYGMSSYQYSMRVAGSITQPIGTVSQVRLNVAGRRTDNEVNDLQDGHGAGTRISYERALSPRLFLSGSLGFDRFKARDGAYSTRARFLAVTAHRDFGRSTLNASAEIGRLKADDRLLLLPEAREDKSTRLQVGAVFRQISISGLAPIARVVFERNKSNIEFYDFRRTRAEVGVSRSF